MDSAHGEDSNGTLFSAQLSLFGRDDISSSDYKGDGLPAYPGQYWDDEDLLDIAEGAPKHDTNVEIRAPPLLTRTGDPGRICAIEDRPHGDS